MKQAFKRQPYTYRNYATFRRPPAAPAKKRRVFRKFALVLVLLVIVAGSGTYALAHVSKKPAAHHATTSTSNNSNQHVSSKAPAQSAAQLPTQTATKPTTTNYCAGNTLAQLVLVSISKQHLWACDGTTAVYNSAVVTGMELYAADLTPPGTYHVYAKETNQDLKGCDATGCWDDHVSYWMPFLDNQYGQYGFHDATWRKPSQFGHVNIYAPDTAAVVGSHGCVELPLATAKWLYNWAPIGTTVTVKS